MSPDDREDIFKVTDRRRRLDADDPPRPGPASEADSESLDSAQGAEAHPAGPGARARPAQCRSVDSGADHGPLRPPDSCAPTGEARLAAQAKGRGGGWRSRVRAGAELVP